MKRIGLILLTVIVIISMIMGSSLSASAAVEWWDDHGYGTEEDGVIPANPSGQLIYPFTPYYIVSDTNGLPNGDFEQGLKYWTSCSSMKPADSVDIIEEDGNHFMRFTPSKNYEGIETLRFVDDRIKVGDTIAVMYDWRSNDPNFGVILWQDHNGESREGRTTHRVSQGRSGIECVLVEAQDDKEWNRGLTPIKSADMPKMVPIVTPTNESGKIYLGVMVQINNDPTTVADIDNIQLVHYNENTGDVKDLDGNKLYNVNEIQSEAKDEIKENDFDIDFGDGNEEVEEEIQENKEEQAEQEEAGAEDTEGFVGSMTFWIIIGVGAAVIIAAVVIVIIVVSKKKKAALPKEEAEETEETEETEE